ncbi:solute carrier family 2, facilitated glucose transporter member 1 [Lepisosteus oculatus]|uniref:Solute carrier family 2, facilitated glucose transporter member 5 n=1 Tax=Lepisosteus oculatus TaxID=7918 RepID=W5N6L0_LEPOC|nr:PREDICTED: solute carrier family 2, facilitated glucose transporter member 1-like isoform X1 [Lepisosteus oculatus]
MESESSPLTGLLLTSIFSAVLGSLQIGYHTGNINAPERVIIKVFNSSWQSHYNTSISETRLAFLWSLSVSGKDFGAVLGAVGVKWLADSFGRRNSILIANALSIAASLLMSIAQFCMWFEALILGRLIFGMFCGLAMSLNPLYIQEISPTALRGAFSTLNQISFTTGILLGMVMSLNVVMGSESLWGLMLQLSLVPAAMQYFTLAFCPESPRYLLINLGEEVEAETALRRLRGNSGDIRAEMMEMKQESSFSPKCITVREFVQKQSYREPIMILTVICLGANFSGFNAMINYSTDVFLRVGFEEAEYLTLGVGSVNVLFSIVSFFLVETAGRRKLLLVGFLALGVCNLLMSISSALLNIFPQMAHLHALLVFGLIAAYESGPGPISWFIGAELFNQSARPVAMSFSSILNWGSKCLLAFIFPPLMGIAGPYTYLVFMVFALIAFFFTLARVPETRGRVFNDIAAEFQQTDSLLLTPKKLKSSHH